MKKNTSIAIILLVIIVGLGFLLVWHYHSLKSVPSTLGTPSKPISYVCNADKTITAVYYEGVTTPSVNPDQPPVPGGSVEVTLSDGRHLVLHQTLSADGTRYANADESFVFWGKGNGALVLEDNTQKNYIGCVMIAQLGAGSSLTQSYANGSLGFSLRIPPDFSPNEAYEYQLSPSKTISGVKFTIPETLAAGTNLSVDSYLSVESMPQTASCTADLFIDGIHPPQQISEGDVEYSVATSSDAGAGNRYEETVYAIPGTNPCVAVRYFIHYGVVQNYPEGTVKEFDKQALLDLFDEIRQTLVLVTNF
jgi:membrane-bound inhibitor of C-type lysozyme